MIATGTGQLSEDVRAQPAAVTTHGCRTTDDTGVGRQVLVGSIAPITPSKLERSRAPSTLECDHEQLLSHNVVNWREALRPDEGSSVSRIDALVGHLQRRKGPAHDTAAGREHGWQRSNTALSTNHAALTSTRPRGDAVLGQRSGMDVWPESELSKRMFEQRYMALNEPVMISGAIDHWPALERWVAEDGGINLEAIQQDLGNCRGLATDVSRLHQESGRPPRLELSVSEFIDMWPQRCFHSCVGEPKALEASKDGTPGDISDADGGGGGVGGKGRDASGSESLLYLSFDLSADFPQHQAYEVPHFFSEDWLSEYGALPEARPIIQRFSRDESSRQGRSTARASEPLTAMAPPSSEQSAASFPSVSRQTPGESGAARDYCFFFVGTRGTWTRFHVDVFKSYSWSSVLAGRKRWLLLPPCHAHLLRSSSGRALAPDFSPEFLNDTRTYPGLYKAADLAIEVIQEAGETLFVPSGWAHTVENLEDTLSVNHNWFNAFNIAWFWDYMQSEGATAAAALSTYRGQCSPEEFESLVQRKLKVNTGLEYGDLEGFLSAIVRCGNDG